MQERSFYLIQKQQLTFEWTSSYFFLFGSVSHKAFQQAQSKSLSPTEAEVSESSIKDGWVRPPQSRKVSQDY